MQQVERGNQEFMCILLLVTRQVARVSPNEVQETEGDVGSSFAGIEFLQD